MPGCRNPRVVSDIFVSVVLSVSIAGVKMPSRDQEISRDGVFGIAGSFIRLRD